MPKSHRVVEVKVQFKKEVDPEKMGEDSEIRELHRKNCETPQ